MRSSFHWLFKANSYSVKPVWRSRTCRSGPRSFLTLRPGFACKSTHSQPETNNINYCVDLVRKNDHENYLCTLLLPKDARTAAFVIRAFNVELAQVRDSVSERHIGKMRIQFWKDALDHIYNGQPPIQPVAVCLSQVVENHKLTKKWLQRLIDSRERNLDDRVYMNLDEVEEYGENSVSPVLYLILESLGVKDVHADHAASHLGKAIGLTTLVRSIPYHFRRRQTFIPVDLLVKHGLSQEDIIRGKNPEKLKECIFDVASQAHIHLEKARNMKNSVPQIGRRALLPAVSCHLYLKELQRVHFDVFHPVLQKRDWKLPLRILVNAWTKSY